MFSSDDLIRWVDFALAKKAPNRIPRTGPAAAAVDCFSVSILLPDGRYNVEERTGASLRCRFWPIGASEWDTGTMRDLSIYRAWSGKPDIHHYLGIYEGSWSSWTAFATQQRFRVFRARVQLHRIYTKGYRRVQAQRKLVTTERMRVLSAAFAHQVEHGEPATYTNLMISFHGAGYFFHPDGHAAGARMNQLLSGLTQTGELTGAKNGYHVTGVGIASIERYEEDERKHLEAMKQQKIMAWLTAILLFSALVQAKLVELPPIIKLESWPWSGAS